MARWHETAWGAAQSVPVMIPPSGNRKDHHHEQKADLQPGKSGHSSPASRAGGEDRLPDTVAGRDEWQLVAGKQLRKRGSTFYGYTHDRRTSYQPILWSRTLYTTNCAASCRHEACRSCPVELGFWDKSKRIGRPRPEMTKRAMATDRSGNRKTDQMPPLCCQASAMRRAARPGISPMKGITCGEVGEAHPAGSHVVRKPSWVPGPPRRAITMQVGNDQEFILRRDRQAPGLFPDDRGREGQPQHPGHSGGRKSQSKSRPPESGGCHDSWSMPHSPIQRATDFMLSDLMSPRAPPLFSQE